MDMWIFWAGNPTVQLLDADGDLGAMPLERCVPGEPLRKLPETEQNIVISALRRRLALAVGTSLIPPFGGND